MINALYLFLISLYFIFWIYLQIKNKDGVAITINNIFFLFFMLIPGYIQYKSEAYPWLHYLFVHEDRLESSLILLIIYSLFFIIGYLVVSLCNFNFSKKQNNISRDIKHPCWARINVFSIIISVPSLYLISKLGIPIFFSGRTTTGDQIYNEADSLSMLYAFAKFSIYAILIGLIIIRQNEIIKKTLINNMIFIYIASINFIVNNPLSSPRFHFLGMILGLLLVYGYLLKPVQRILLSYMAPMFLYVIFPFTKTLGLDVAHNSHDVKAYLTTGVDFDCIIQMVNIYQYVIDGNYSFGANILGGITFFIPRAIWIDKPNGLGHLSSEYIGLLYNNLSAPWPGELFYIFGYPSLILGAFLTGVLFAKIDIILFRRRTNTIYGLSVILTGFIFIILRGEFTAIFPVVFLSLVVYFVFMQIAKPYQKIFSYR